MVLVEYCWKGRRRAGVLIEYAVTIDCVVVCGLGWRFTSIALIVEYQNRSICCC